MNGSPSTPSAKVHPLGDRMIVRLVREETRRGMLVRPRRDEASMDDPRLTTQYVEVVEPGPTLYDMEAGAYRPKPGDRLWIGRFVGYVIEAPDGEELIVVEEKDALAIEKAAEKETLNA